MLKKYAACWCSPIDALRNAGSLDLIAVSQERARGIAIPA
jgi:hypothetical protein